MFMDHLTLSPAVERSLEPRPESKACTEAGMEGRNGARQQGAGQNLLKEEVRETALHSPGPPHAWTLLTRLYFS